MALIILVNSAREQWWLRHLQSLLPEIECRLWNDPGDLDQIEFAVVWRPPTGGLKRFKNLQCIVSIGAGIDHVLADAELPSHVPIIRTTGADLTQRMREYACLHVLRFHRRLMDSERNQTESRWERTVNPPAYKRRVGIMGQGNLGADVARSLAFIGFDVAGWSRTPKQNEGVASYFGADQLPAFLQRTDILVCVLPLTKATSNILNASLFSQLPNDACLINVARGEHLVEQDLIDALDSGRLAYATLDVFRQEPLEQTHPFWKHPKILVTPHVASLIDPESGGKEIARNLLMFIAGKPVPDLVDLEQGY